MKTIDLHIHTTASDGTCSPAEAAALAKKVGLAAIALTDHDTMDGVRALSGQKLRGGLEIIPGIEISTIRGETEIHVLGYFLSPGAPALEEFSDWCRRERHSRNRAIAEKLHAQGLDVDIGELEAAHAGNVTGRPHIARKLLEIGAVSSIQEAFDRYLGEGAACYVPRTLLPFREAADLIGRCGGIAVLAHPYQYQFSPEELEALAREAAERGMAGIEVYYTGYTAPQRQFLLDLGKKYDLLPTGGSDFHGENKPDIRIGRGRGDLEVPASLLRPLRERWKLIAASLS